MLTDTAAGGRLKSRLLGGGVSAAAVAAALSSAAAGAPVDIVKTAGSLTTVDLSVANTATITTTSIANGVGFNRFDHFNVAAAQSATLVVPASANSLVNIVRDAAAINGTVTSAMGSAAGKAGGNLFFVVPSGLIIGATGTINTGRLIVRGTPAGSASDTPALHDVLGGSAASLVQIDGRVNAPGGVDIKAATLTMAATGAVATGKAGLTAIPAIDADSLVSTAGLASGDTIVARDGGISIVATGNITLAAGSSLDARPATYAAATPFNAPGGITITGNGAIAANGMVTAWDGTSATAGDISITTDKQALLGSTLPDLLEASVFAGSSATTGITIGGAVKGGVVTIASTATGSTQTPAFDAPRLAINLLVDKLAGKLLSTLSKGNLGLDAFVSLASATSGVTVGSGASVTAQGDLSLTAGSTAAGSATANTKSGGTLAASIVYSDLASRATIGIDGNLTAGGALSVNATNTATSTVSVRAVSETGATAIAFGYNDIDVKSAVTVGGAAHLTGASVTIGATNKQAKATDGFTTKAYTITTDTGKGGGVAAVTNENVDAAITIAGTVAATNDVTIKADTTTNRNIGSASSSTGNGAFQDFKSVVTGADIGTLLGDAFDKFAAKLSKDKETKPGGGSEKSPAKRFAAAVTVSLVEQSATTAVTGSITAGGTATVGGTVQDLTVRNNASAAASAQRVVNGASQTIAGAVAWGRYDYTATATVGGSVAANALAVNAVTNRPRGENYDLSLPGSSSGGDLLSWVKADILPKANTSLGLESGFFGSSAGASAENDSAQKASFGASLAYNRIDTNTRAWIDQGAKLTLGPKLDVTAVTDIVELSLGGPIALKTLGFGVKSGGNAVGGAVAYSDINATTVAGIDSGVVQTRAAGTAATAAKVTATGDIELITVAPLAGQGGDATLTGTFAVNQVDGKTHATISNLASLDLGGGTLTLAADTTNVLYAVGGSLAYTKADGTGGSDTATSVGIAGALNLTSVDTRARVGDASGDDATANTVPATPPVGGITAGGVAATALTHGSVTALSVAGVANDTSPAVPKAPDEEKPKSDGESSSIGADVLAYLSKAGDAFSSMLPGFIKTYQKEKAFEKQARGFQEDAANADAMENGKPVTKGFGLAGSASVNISDAKTTVDLTSAKFTRGGTAPTAAFLVRAAEGVDMLAITGGASVATGNKPLESNTLIAGAFGLSYTSNATGATLTDTTLDGFDGVAVEGASNGGRIGAGLSLAVDTTETTKGQVVAGSLSMLIAQDAATASVTGGHIYGPTGGTGALSILAYDGLTIGAGAGALSFGSSNGFGAALTVIDIAAPNASNATLQNTSVNRFGDLSVRALNASRVAGVAAAGSVAVGGADSKAGAVSLSFNSVTMAAKALVDVGTLGADAINIGGKLTTYAGDLAADGSEAIAGAATTAATPASGFFANYQFNSDSLPASAPISLSDLQGGSQIFSVALPIVVSTGKAAGLALSINSIDNDRTATILGAGTSSIHAGSVAVSAVDRASILSLSAGIGGGKGGGAIGSLSLNQIDGASTASIDRSASSTGRFRVMIGSAGTAPGSAPNLTVNTIGNANIFSLAGAVVVGKDAAGGLALGLNEIVRASAASDPGASVAAGDAGLHAGINDVALAGSPDVSIAATSNGSIKGIAFAGAGSTGQYAVAGASTANKIAPVVIAEASNLTYLDTAKGDLKITADDTSTIFSTALTLAAGKDGAASAGVSVNLIDTRVGASLTATGTAGSIAMIDVRDLVIAAKSLASTTSIGIGVAASKSFSAAGSIGVNTTTAHADALLALDYANIVSSGSVAVDATRDSTVDVGAGALSLSAQGLAIGASVVVDTVGGGASAKLTGTSGHASSLTIAGGGNGIAGQRSGDLLPNTSLPQFDGLDLFKNTDLTGIVTTKLATSTVRGLSVDASSTHASRTIAVTGAVAAEGVGAAVTAVVSDIGGTTTAAVSDADVTVGDLGAAANSALGVNVNANSTTLGVTFAGAIAAGSLALAAPVVSDGFNATTTASITGGNIRTSGNLTVRAAGIQTSTALALSAGLGQGAAVAVAAVSPRFQATTSASIDSPIALVALGSGGIAVNATSDARAFATFGAIGVGGTGAAAAAVVVATNENTTSATYTGVIDGTTGEGSVVVNAPKIAVTATGGYDAKVAGASVAAGSSFALVGNGIGIVHRGVVTATADGLNVARNDADVDINATEVANFQPITGQAAISFNPVSAGAALGVVVVLAQSKVDAQLIRPFLDGVHHVGVNAYGVTGVDALQLGVAVGGVGIGANVTYIGVGKVQDTGALFAGGGSSDDDSVAANAGSSDGGNSNLTMLGSGGTSASDAAAPAAGVTDTSAATAGAATSRAAFTGVKTADDAASARVRAQITGGGTVPTVNASDVSVTSSANLVSKSSNYQLTGGIGAGSATIGITRNAANSIARIGSGVVATGDTLNLSATTGQDGSKLPSSLTKPTHAAEALVVGGSVGGLTLAVAMADVKLQTVAVAEVDGGLGFTTATIHAGDTSDAVAYVVGVAAGAASANVAVAKAVKEGTVGALLAGQSISPTLTITADGAGATSATTYAASGGLLFAGNAAVALAQDSRTVTAQLAEGAGVYASHFTLKATATPDLTSYSFGIAVGGQVAIGASVATATSDTTVKAQVGEGAVLDCTHAYTCSSGDSFVVDAELLRAADGTNISAVAKGSAGGTLLGLNATVARANNTATVAADVGANLSMLSSAPTMLGAVPLTVTASRGLGQYAEANGITVSLILAIGAQDAKSTSSGSVEASVTHVDGSQRPIDSTTNLTVTAASNDYNEAKAVAGAGGLGAGVAALAATDTGGTVTATVAPDATKVVPAVYDKSTPPKLITPEKVVATPLRVGALTVSATSAAEYKSNTDATQASAVGGSGSTNSNTVNTSATVNIGKVVPAGTAQGNNSRIEAASFKVLALDTIGTTGSTDGGQAKGAGGGVLTGAAALVDNHLTQAANVVVGDGTILRQYGGNANLNTLASFFDARVETYRSHSVALDVGGVMQLPFGKINTSSVVNTGVVVGQNVLIRGDQGIGIGSVVLQQIADTEATAIYGFAGIGGGNTDTRTTVTQGVSVKDGTTIEGIGDVRVSAGTSGDGNSHDRITASAQTDVFNWTLLPISVDHGATASATVNNTLSLGSAVIRSARDVNLSALKGSVNASAVGTGHDPYKSLAKALGISITDDGGDASTGGTGTINLDGTQVTAGFLAHRKIEISGGTSSWTATETDNDGRSDIVRTVSSPGSTATSGDTLGQYTVATIGTSAVDIVNGQITALQVKPGIGAILDPNGVTDEAAHKKAQDDLDKLAASSSDIASLSLLYDTRAALAENGTSPSNGVKIDGVFAAAGLVGVDADAVVRGGQLRTASVVANSSPNITITNTSNFNTALGDLFIPSKPAGAVSYGGKADEAKLLAVATIVKAGPDNTPDGLISVTNGSGPFSAPRTDVLNLGHITNVGGALKVVVNNGAYAQFGAVDVGSFSADVPNGPFIVSTDEFNQGLPINLYYGNLGWSLYDTKSCPGVGCVHPTLDANRAATLVASYIAEKNFYDGDGAIANGFNGLARLKAAVHARFPTVDANQDPIYSLFLDSNYRKDFTGNIAPSKPYPLTSVYFQGCAGQTCELESDDNALNSNLISGMAVYDPGRTYYTPSISFDDPVRQLTVNDAVRAANYPTIGGGDAKLGGRIDALQVKITANVVDISGTITAGPKKSRCLYVSSFFTGASAGPLTDGRSAPLQTILNGFFASGNIGVRYVADGNYLQVDDVAAGAGGSIDIKGRILNTNPLGGGKLKVLDGFANIFITNDSNLDLHLGTLNAGANVAGRIKLVDTGFSNGVATTETTIYRNTPGQAVTKDHAYFNGTTTVPDDQVALPFGVGTSDSNVITYTPRGSAYYSFTDSRALTRTEDYSTYNDDNKFVDGLYATAWAYSASGGQAPQSGNYVDLGSNDSAASRLKAALGTARPDAVQLVTGDIGIVTKVVGGVTKYYYDATTRRVSRTAPTADRITVTGLTINIETAVKATNPIALVFDQGGGGGLTVASTYGGIVVGGQITYTGGTVNLFTDKTVTAAGDGAILANSLYLRGNQGIGTAPVAATMTQAAKAAVPIVAALAGSDATGTGKVGGTVTALASAGSIYLDLTSATTTSGALDAVALNLIDAAGTVSITANSGLLGTDRGTPNIKATTIALTAGGSIGGIGAATADPLFKRALLIQLGSGKLDVTSGGDVTIESANIAGTSDQLRLGSINAQGDVLLRGWGSIVAASNDTTVDADKLARFLGSAKALQLDPTAAAGEDCSGKANCIIIPSKLAVVETQVRNQARAAYDVVARVTGTSKNTAIDAAATNIGAVNTLVAKGVTLSGTWQVTLSDGALADASVQTIAASALPGGIKGSKPTGAETALGIQAYVDTARKSIIPLFDTASPTVVLALTTTAAIRAALPPGNDNSIYALNAVGTIGVLNGLAGKGVGFSSVWGVTLTPAALADASVRTLALDTLRSRSDALPGVANEQIALPTDADVLRGIQAYVDKTRAPLISLFGSNATPTTILPLTTVAAVQAAIDPSGYAVAGAADLKSATATLTTIFGFVPSDRSQIGTLAFADGYFAARQDGAVWQQSQLDFSVPSTAFVPVADTQFETRAPVITARNVTLIAGNSIGNFADPQTFTFAAAGLVDSNGNAVTDKQSKDLAAAYLASAGPGDLNVILNYTVANDPKTAVKSVAFTTRRDQPLQLDAGGVVNAFAATDLGTLGTTARGPGLSTVAGDIFLSNRNDFKIGSIVSQKGRSGSAARDDCNYAAGGLASGCDSRIHLQGNSLIGVVSGAAQLVSNTSRLSNSDGRAIVMGGLVRLEASNGPLSASDGTALLIDARALETVRAAGNVTLAKRSPVTIPFANPDTGGGFHFPNDLVLGDTFAAATLTLDNPYGSFFVGALPSNIASEDRNARIVAGTLVIRAAGDIGADGDNPLTGRSNQLDIQAPRILTFVAGYDYPGGGVANFGNGKVGVGPAPIGLAAGDGFFALRGVSVIGGPGSVLGARNNITIGAVPDYTNHSPAAIGGGNGIEVIDPSAIPSIFSSIDIESSIQIGGAFNLTTDGSLNFGPDVNINSLGKSARSDCASNPTVVGCELDLSRLHLNLKGTFNITTPRSLLLGSLSAGGGTIESTMGYVNVNGTLFGIGGPDKAFTVKGKTGVTAGSVGAGAVALISSAGNVEVTGTASAADVTATGINVLFDGGNFGRSATLTALAEGVAAPDGWTGSVGTIVLGGPVFMSRTESLPDLPASFTATGRKIVVADLLGSNDAITLTATEIGLTPGALIVGGDATTVALTAKTFTIDPHALVAGVGALNLVQTAGGTAPVVLPTFNGGALSVLARGDIVAGRIAATGDVLLSAATVTDPAAIVTGTAGTVTLTDGVDAGGAVTIGRRVKGAQTSLAALTFGANGNLNASGSADLRAGTIAAAGHSVVTSGALTLVSATSLSLGTLSAGSGVVTLTPALRAPATSLTLGTLGVTGGSLRLSGTGDLAIGSASVSGNLDTAGFAGVTVSGPVTLAAVNPGDALNLTAKGVLTLTKTASITGTNDTAQVNLAAASIAGDPAATIKGTSLSATTKGVVALGSVLANPLTQAVIIRGGPSVTTKALSGATIAVTAATGTITVGALGGGRATLVAASDIVTAGMALNAAQATTSGGSVTLGGTTRITASGNPATATLSVSASKAITIDGATSAAGGIGLTAPTIVTTAKAYLTDTDRFGAVTTLRAQTVNVAFNTGKTIGTPLRVAVRGLSTANAADVALTFASLRPVTFDLLYADRTTLTAGTALTITKLNMVDWLLFNLPGQSVALKGNKTPPAAGRTIATGALTGAKVVATPGSGVTKVTINGGLR